MLIVSIDPGLKGGISVFSSENETVTSINTPLKKKEKGSKETKEQYDIVKMAEIVKISYEGEKKAIIEKVGPRPMEGRVSVFRFGMGVGLWLGILATLGFETEEVLPQVWKKHFSLSQDKEESRELATKLFPQCQDMWKRKKDDGVAESILIGRYYADKIGISVDNYQAVKYI